MSKRKLAKKMDGNQSDPKEDVPCCLYYIRNVRHRKRKRIANEGEDKNLLLLLVSINGHIEVK